MFRTAFRLARASRVPRFGARSFSSRTIVASKGVATGFATIAGFALAGTQFALCADKKIPPEGVPDSIYERTFIAVKPDGVQRGLIGKIIQRFEDKGFKLVALKLLTPTEAQAQGHYQDLKSKPFFPGLVKFFSSGPIVAMVWEGKGVVKTGRKMLGETNPAASLPGSIRGDFCVDIGRNIIHGSDSTEGAKHEINFWFKDNEISSWTPDNEKWVY